MRSSDAGAAAPRVLAGRVVSAIGFGTWAMGGPHTRDGRAIGWGAVDDDESVAAIREALDAGVNLFDTADVYGCGHSERVLARALPEDRSDIVVATKFGYTYDERTRESPGTDASPDYIRRACEASLRRLRADVLDVYEFHLGDYPLERAPEVLATLEALVDEGKIRSFGWSTDDAARAGMFAASPNCAAVQMSFNLFEGDPAVLAVAEVAGIAALVRSPLAMGLLGGTITAETRFSPTDIRNGWDFAGTEGRRLGALQRIRSTLTADGRTPAQGALAWLLARSGSLVPIPGIRTAAHMRENAQVLAQGPLTAEQMSTIDRELAAVSGSGA